MDSSASFGGLELSFMRICTVIVPPEYRQAPLFIVAQSAVLSPVSVESTAYTKSYLYPCAGLTVSLRRVILTPPVFAGSAGSSAVPFGFPDQAVVHVV